MNAAFTVFFTIQLHLALAVLHCRKGVVLLILFKKFNSSSLNEDMELY